MHLVFFSCVSIVTELTLYIAGVWCLVLVVGAGPATAIDHLVPTLSLFLATNAADSVSVSIDAEGDGEMRLWPLVAFPHTIHRDCHCDDRWCYRPQRRTPLPHR